MEIEHAATVAQAYEFIMEKKMDYELLFLKEVQTSQVDKNNVYL